jgi:hypothetical protein
MGWDVARMSPLVANSHPGTDGMNFSEPEDNEHGEDEDGADGDEDDVLVTHAALGGELPQRRNRGWGGAPVKVVLASVVRGIIENRNPTALRRGIRIFEFGEQGGRLDGQGGLAPDEAFRQ